MAGSTAHCISLRKMFIVKQYPSKGCPIICDPVGVSGNVSDKPAEVVTVVVSAVTVFFVQY